MTLEYKDIAGNEISVGSIIAYAALSSNSAVIKYAIVTSLSSAPSSSDEHPAPTIKVISADNFGDGTWIIQAEGQERVITWLSRTIVLDDKQIPEKARTLLTRFYTGLQNKFKKSRAK